MPLCFDFNSCAARRVALCALLLPVLPAGAGLEPEQLKEALDSGESITWYHPLGDWQVVPGGGDDGEDALRTPAGMESGGQAVLTARVSGPGTLKGWVKVSSEPVHDALQILVQNAPVLTLSGEQTKNFTVDLGTGTHTVTFVWSKDASRTLGADAAWLDKVRVEPLAIPVAEVLDVAGTASADLVVFSTPSGAQPWLPASPGGSELTGGDALYAPSESGDVRKLQAVVNVPSIVTFRSRGAGSSESPWAGGDFEVTFPDGVGRAYTRTTNDGGRQWQVVVPQAPATLVFTHAGRHNPARVAGAYLDDFSVQRLNPATVAEALDMPGMQFSMAWRDTFAAHPINQPWLSARVTGSNENPGFQGGDALIYQPPVFSPPTTQFAPPAELGLTVPGPGYLRFRWKTPGDAFLEMAGQVTLRNDSTAKEERVLVALPVTAEWQTQTVEVPPGSHTVKWIWESQPAGLMLDDFSFTSALRSPFPPAVGEALDVAGVLNLVSPGDWRPGQWAGAGFGNDDAATWPPPGMESATAPLIATVTGPGWFSFAWTATTGTIGFTVNGAEELLSGAPRAGHPAWQQKAVLLPVGSHTLTWIPLSDAGNQPEGAMRLDGFRFQTSPPAWVEAVEGAGLNGMRQSEKPWQPVTDVTRDGTDALRTPPTETGGTASLTSTVTGPGTLRFCWKVNDPVHSRDAPGSGENSFRLDTGGFPGSFPVGISGETDWKEEIIQLPEAKSYHLAWIFQRSGFATRPEDGAWLDQVSFTPATTTTAGEALDAPGLAWNSSGSLRPLTGGGLAEANGGDALKAAAEAGTEAWIETTVSGPGLISVRHKGIIPGKGNPKVEVDGQPVAAHSDSRGTRVLVYGAGPHTWRFTVRLSQEELELDAFTFTPLPLVKTAEALDLPVNTMVSIAGSSETAINAGFADPGAAKDGTDAVKLESIAPGPGAELMVWFNGPARIRYWWRGEGADDSYSTVSGPGAQSYGTFGWEEREFISERAGPDTMTFYTVSPYAVQRLWIDRLRIEPFEEAPLAEALDAAPLTFTNGGESAAIWKGRRLPGQPAVSDESYADIHMPGDDVRPAWLETRVMGPGYLVCDIRAHGGEMPVTVTRRAASGNEEPVTLPSLPALIPAGAHIIRFSAQRIHSTYPELRSVATLRGFDFTPPISAGEALDNTSLTFSTTAAPGIFWYGGTREESDSNSFSGDDLFKLKGEGTLSMNLTGPGWLWMEAGAPEQRDPGPGPRGPQIMSFHLTPPGPLPDPAPEPQFQVDFSDSGQGDFLRKQFWIPAGNWSAHVAGEGELALNRIAFVPAIDASAAANALDLAGSVTMNLPGQTGGAILAPVSHDGTDALQLTGRAGDDPLVNFSFSGPALVTCWMRFAWAIPYSDSNTEPPVPGEEWIQPADDLLVLLDGVPVNTPLPERDAGGWVPFRLPVTGLGPHTLSLAVRRFMQADKLLQLDEFTVSTLSAVNLGGALDTAGLTWTTGGSKVWSGGAAPAASPDNTDAAWVLVPPGDGDAWLEAQVTGPGSFSVSRLNPARMTVAIGAAEPETLLPSGAEWVNSSFFVPAGPQTIRITVEAFETTAQLYGLDEARWEPGTEISLTDAFDVPAGMSLTASGDLAAGFKGCAIPALSHDGTDAILFSGPLNGSVALETTVTGPAMVSFRMANRYVVSPSFTIDGKPARGPGGFGAAAAMGPPDAEPDFDSRLSWRLEEVLIPAGPHVLKWELQGDDEVHLPYVLLGLDSLKVTPLHPAPSLAEAIDQGTWTVTGSPADKVLALAIPAAAHDETDAVLLTGHDDPAQWPALTAMVPGPGIVFFRWRPAGQSWTLPEVTVEGGTTGMQMYFAPPDGLRNQGCVVVPHHGPAAVSWRQPGNGQGVWLDEVTFSPGLSPGTAAGAPELSWTTGGPEPWLGMPKPVVNYDDSPGVSFAEVWHRGGADNWIEATVNGPGRLSFEATPAVSLSFDGRVLKHLNGEGIDNRYTLIVPSGAHKVRWTCWPSLFPSDGVACRLSRVTFTPSGSVDPIADALDAPSLPWLFPGIHVLWSRQTGSTFDGVDALRTATPYGTWLATVLPGPGTAFARARGQGTYSSLGNAWRVTKPGFSDPPTGRLEFRANPSGGASGDPDAMDLDQFEWTPAGVSLAEALDTPGREWRTSPNVPFSGFASTSNQLTHDLSDAAAMGLFAAGSWLETTVTGPARISFWSTGYLSFTVNSAAVPLEEFPGWHRCEVETGPGEQVLRWAGLGNSAAMIDEFSTVTFPVSGTLAAALDHPGPWMVESAAGWAVSTTDHSDGQDAALFTGLTGSVGTFVEGPGRLEFYGKAPWQVNEAYPAVPLVEAPKAGAAWYGLRHPTWTKHEIDTIPPGRHLVKWPVSLNGAAAFSAAAAGLDQIKFTPYQPAPLADALEVAGLMVTTNEAAPWRGWLAGSAAADGTDAAISGGSGDSWMDVRVPAGAGALRFRARAPGGGFFIHLHAVRDATDGYFRPLPVEWKWMEIAVPATGPRVFRFTVNNGNPAWMDSLSFVSASTMLETWLSGHGLPAGLDPEADSDGDGYSLLMDYAFGLKPGGSGMPDPSAPAGAGLPVFSYERITPWIATLQCRFYRRTAVTGLRYEVFYTDDPAQPFDYAREAVVTPVSDDWELVTVNDQMYLFPGAAPKARFGRVRVTLER